MTKQKERKYLIVARANDKELGKVCEEAKTRSDCRANENVDVQQEKEDERRK